MLSDTEINDSQSKFSLAFKDAELEQAFRSEHARQTLPQVRKALIIAAILYALFTIMDFVIVASSEQQQWATMLVRFGFAIPSFILAYIATYRLYFRQRLQIMISIIIFIAGLGIVTIGVLYEKTHSEIHLSATFLPVFWAFIYSGLRFINAVIVALSLLVTFNAAFFLFLDLSLATLVTYNFLLVTSIVIGMLGGYTIESYYRRDFVREQLLELEKRDNEKLLLNILPKHIAEELKATTGTIAKDYEQITVLFTDLVGFTELSRCHSAKQVVGILNDVFCQFDKLTDELELEKIKTIGDAYMVTSNLLNPQGDSALRVAAFALGIKDIINRYNQKTGYHICLRTGIHTGTAVAGVIGVKKFVYDVWGNTVNIASRMESECPVGGIQVSQESYMLLKDKFNFEDRGQIEVKGFENMRAYLLIDAKS